MGTIVFKINHIKKSKTVSKVQERSFKCFFFHKFHAVLIPDRFQRNVFIC